MNPRLDDVMFEYAELADLPEPLERTLRLASALISTWLH
jgi:hypothetical protein